MAQPAHALGEGEAKAASAALYAADHGRWDEAFTLADRTHSRAFRKYVAWLGYTKAGTLPNFDEVTRFIQTNPDWPSVTALRRRADDALSLGGVPAARIVAWYRVQPPVSADGAEAYVQALIETGDGDGATATARQLLVETPMKPDQLRDFARTFASRLRPEDFALRADRLIWEGDYDGASSTLPYLKPAQQLLVQARVALATQSAGASAALDRVPTELKTDIGLLFERVRWRRRNDRDAEALELLAAVPPTVPHPNAWWSEQALLARRAFQRQDYRAAYDIARNHHQREGFPLVDAEWFSGWVALRYLKEPETARRHFATMTKAAQTPISLSRAYYWSGRAAEAANDAAAAQHAYAEAARHVGTFYGQLAFAKLHAGAPLPLPAHPVFSRVDADEFEARETVQVVRILNQIHQRDRAEPFLRRIGELTDTPVGAALVARLARETGSLYASVNLAKRLSQNGVALLADGYPLLPKHPHTPEPALIHAVIRQESLFDKGAVSPSGALGLMQLMPATAKLTAAKLKIKRFKPDTLTEDGHLDVVIGASYLEELIDRFSGSYVLSVAAYNGGPGRVSGWLREIGDPRPNVEKTVDWIESIPVGETRNYVQRVIENVGVYRARMNPQAPLGIERDLAR